ncbi:FG-GAP-like repeat-containing protein [Streptomyces sp. KN37]|uniref:FG-GAP-like repeat-containing protein n=1 Tax=Streptomyces sp. KN37 TaxID=3090667 RepID=UPI002A766C30|nr:FG-GAP-like repeat-containing protein [Streptomyces sp. KN37]WPO73119.1 FG-GAP-like repeat-containing protein [Streptomyces sp. KN37]
MPRRTLITAIAVAALTTPLALFATSGSASAAPVPPRTPMTDFNHDGYADLAVAAPHGTVDGVEKAGYVSVVYGTASGPGTARHQLISRATPGVPGELEGTYAFGYQSIPGDLDGDSYTDLLVAGGGDENKATVLWGSKDGLTGQNTLLPCTYSDFALGDFNGDGKRDLVVNSHPSDDPDVSGMTIQYGPFTRDGKTRTQDSITTDDGSSGLRSFITGDLTGDGVDDIVTTHGFEEMQHEARFWKGSKTGVSHTAKSLGTAYSGTVGDVDGDGYGDLITRDIGSVTEVIDSAPGSITIQYGSSTGPSDARKKVITQATAGVPGASEENDAFGASLSAGDVNGDGKAEVAVGVPGESLDAATGTGAVILLKGAAKAEGGMTGKGAVAYNQSTAGVPGVSETGDDFGRQVSLTDLNKDGKADLTATAPGEDGTYADSGALWNLYGSASGLTTTGAGTLSPAKLGAPEKGAAFGLRLGA